MNAAWESLSRLRGGIHYEYRRAHEVLRTLDNQWRNQARELAELKRKAKLTPAELVSLAPRWSREVRLDQFPDIPNLRPGAPMVLPWQGGAVWYYHNLEPPKSR